MKDADPDMRAAIVSALGELGDAARRAGAARRAQGRIRHRPRAAPPRRSARSAIATSVDALIAAAKDKNADVRRRVINALGEIGDERALDTLTQALKDEDAAIRRSAAMAIAEIGGDSRIRIRVRILARVRIPIPTRIAWTSGSTPPRTCAHAVHVHTVVR